MSEFRVGDWEILPDSNEIRRKGTSLALEARLMRLLVYLATNRGRVVSRYELLTEVWGKTYLSSHSVSVAVAELRQALGDEAARPRFIETIRKRGYRLIADGREGNTEPRVLTRWIRAIPLTLAACLVLAVAFAPPMPGSPDLRPVVVVKDIVNATGERDIDEFAAALTGLVVAQIAMDSRAVVKKGLPVRDDRRRPYAATVSGQLTRDASGIYMSVYLEDAQTAQILWSSGRLIDRGNTLSAARNVSAGMLGMLMPNTNDEAPNHPGETALPPADLAGAGATNSAYSKARN